MKYLDPFYTRSLGKFCRGIKYFREGQIISNIFAQGVQIFRYFWTGGNEHGGSNFFRDRPVSKATRSPNRYGGVNEFQWMIFEMTS